VTLNKGAVWGIKRTGERSGEGRCTLWSHRKNHLNDKRGKAPKYKRIQASGKQLETSGGDDWPWGGGGTVLSGS